MKRANGMRDRRAPIANGSLAGSALRVERVPVGVGCTVCGSERIAEGVEICAKCRKEYAPTPLDTVLHALGQTEAEFAVLTEIPLRTVIRAATGERVSARVAERLARVTGIEASAFRPPKESEEDDGQ